MSQTPYLFLAFFAISYIYCGDVCLNSEGFITVGVMPNAGDDFYFLNLTQSGLQLNGPFTVNLLDDPKMNITLVATGNSVYMQQDSGWKLGENGSPSGNDIYLADSSNADTYDVLKIYFNPPVTTVFMRFNYDPSYNTTTWGPPNFVVFDENDNIVTCYDIGALGPISTPGAVGGFGIRGVTNSSGIAALQLDGAQMVAWDFTVIRAAPVPVALPVAAPTAQPQAPTAAPIASTPTKTPVAKTSDSVALVVSLVSLMLASSVIMA